MQLRDAFERDINKLSWETFNIILEHESLGTLSKATILKRMMPEVFVKRMELYRLCMADFGRYCETHQEIIEEGERCRICAMSDRDKGREPEMSSILEAFQQDVESGDIDREEALKAIEMLKKLAETNHKEKGK